MKQIQRLLIVKTSSMGDVIHMLPAITDIKRVHPELQVDWVVEEGFASIPAWHPSVNKVIPVAVRRWRKRLFCPSTWKQIHAFKKQLRQAQYDLVIDSQGLFKSAVFSSWVQAPVAGMDKHSARESIASRFYQNTFSVARGQHAVPRNRQLVAQALEYDLDALSLDYGLTDKKLIDGDSLDLHLPERFAVFLHAASTPEKEWSVTQWVSLGKKLNKRGLSVLLPWGNSREHGNATSIANELEQAVVLPRLGLPDLAKMFLKAELLVGEDSGLSHMAAALDRPIVALYLVTDPALTGMMASGVSENNRVINCQVENKEQDVIKVADILYKWLPTAD